MTNEEAISLLVNISAYDIDNKRGMQKQEALAMAIKALEQQPCDNCISREAVMKCFKKWQPYMATRLWDYEQELKDLPSVTPQPKIGHWEYVQYDSNLNIGNWHCSECRGICTEMHSIEDAYNYCPNCGAKMEVEE